MHTYTETETSHGRTDVRHYSLTHAPKTLHRAEEWCGLTTIGKVTRHSTVNGKVSEETRYFISSMACDVEQFAHAVRSHWGIENKLHWCLDVVFREDDSHIHSRHAPAHMSMFRHTCLNLLKQEPSKISIKQKKLKAAWNDEFRAKVLFG